MIGQRQSGSHRTGSVWAAGFTLVELMIVLIIVSILMGIALPAYQNSVRKARRADAKAALLEVAGREERFMLDRSTYTVDMTNLGYASDPMISEDGHYSVDAVACATATIATCYVLTATPVATSPQADDARCTSFILESTGSKTATGSANTECW